MLAGIEFDRERMEEAAGDEMVAATDVADLLVRRGVPFREAHGVVGALVRHALEEGIALSDIEPDRFSEFSTQLDSEYYEVLERESWLDSKRSPGGTSAASLKLQLDRAGRALAAMRP